jgi:2-oxo-4-hydroxy-4-carboxy-5-ureidoimidazoline decarboxylase
MDVAEFDALDAESAATVLRPACASTAWSDALVAARPFGSVASAAAFSDETIARLDWPAVEEALAAHPRIGERATSATTEAAWSRQEQSGAVTADSHIAEALRAGNIAYEQRFGHVFLICATGRSAPDMLADLTERLANEPAAERGVVRRELAAIVRLRLAKILR